MTAPDFTIKSDYRGDAGVPPQAGSGSRASHEADKSSSPKASIPNADANQAPIWRSGVGMAVEAIDTFRRDHRMSRRMTPSERAYDALLDKVLQDISQESRAPWNMHNYQDASDCARAALRSIKVRRGTICAECGGEARDVGGRSLVFHNHPCPALASGMEARRAAAENTDAVHDSPTGAAGDAQGPSA